MLQLRQFRGGLKAPLALALVILITVLARQNTQDLAGLLKYLPAIFDPCAHWDPAQAAEFDPPKCLRARQYREIELFRRDWTHIPWHEHYVLENIAALEQCVLGKTKCPERPLIISGWHYHQSGVEGKVSGEQFWMGGINPLLQQEGYLTILDRSAKILAKIFSESLHMLFFEDKNTLECISNPRCIRPEDYKEATDPMLRHNLTAIPKNEIGNIPLWRIFATTYWGARPRGPPYDYDIPDEDIYTWSFNPLGQRWVITPYPYPGHSYLPLALETRCPPKPVPASQPREKKILILAKEAQYFFWDQGREITKAWDRIDAALRETGHTFVALCPDTEQHKIPTSIERKTELSPQEYQQLMFDVKVMFAIGNPPISPSPYVAICHGVPVVMPFSLKDGNASMDLGWDLYRKNHGPALALGEPYAYTYEYNDIDGIIRQLIKAVQQPISTFTHAGATKIVQDLLKYDYEREYNEAVAANGGKPPSISDRMLARCFKHGHCYLE